MTTIAKNLFALVIALFAFQSIMANGGTSSNLGMKSIVKNYLADDKKDPNLSFPVTEAEAFMGQPFDSPVLNNPNNCTVFYSSSNHGVALVNNMGIVTLVGEGETTITAKSLSDSNYNAGKASYVLTVKPEPEGEVIYEQTFATDLGDFTTEGYNGEYNNIWSFDNQSARADAFGKIDEPCIVTLHSGAVKLEANNKISFDYTAEFFAEDVIAEEMVVCIREQGATEWEDLVMPVCSLSQQFISSDKIIVPEKYDGKTVEIGFRYTAQGSMSAGIWQIRNFTVKSNKKYVEEETNVVFAETFAENMGEFTVDGYNGEEGNNIWTSSMGYVQADGYYKTEDVMTNRLASPVIELTNANHLASFEYRAIYFGSEINKEIQFSVREEGGEWEDFELPVCMVSESDFVNSGYIKIPAAYNGKKIQVAFKYVINDPYACGVWHVRNLVVEKDAPAKSETLLSETFTESLGTFVVEGYNGDNNNIWSFDTYKKAACADAYGKILEETTNYLVSPVFTLSADGNYANFDHSGYYFDDMTLRTKFCVREEGGEWVELDIPCFANDEAEGVNSGNIVIPEQFNGKKVQVAFKYNTPGSASSGVWYINNLVVKSGVAAEKVNPEISFSETEVTYNIGDEFVAPVLNNPNNVVVAYTSSDSAIADVDKTTGVVTIYGEGVVVITATSAETAEFESATASYTITITSSTAIEGVTADELENGKVYDLQGRRVNILTKGIYVVNGKKVFIK